MPDLDSPDDRETFSTEENCWSTIGFAGDRSCAELERLGHCHNCRVFIVASRSLFERPPPPGYAEEWAEAVAQPKGSALVETESLVVFRLADEFMALPTSACEEIAAAGDVHSVPHLTDDVFLGLTSIRGEIQPCFSLAAIMGLRDEAPKRPMLIAVRERGEVWVFPVDEVLTVHRIDPEGISSPPATLGAAHETFTRGLVDWKGRRVDLLDPNLIVRELARRLG